MHHAFLAFTNPVAGVEATFNNWYDSRHVPEVLRYGRGFTGCRRFRLEHESRSGELKAWAYLALYELESDDLAALAENSWVPGSPPLTPFRGLLESDHVAWVYTPQSLRFSSAGAPSESRPLASHLLFLWESGEARKDDAWLQNAVENTEGVIAARAYELASAQRRNQLSSPWNHLVVCELQHAGVKPPGKFAAAWGYTAVSDHVRREDLP